MTAALSCEAGDTNPVPKATNSTPRNLALAMKKGAQPLLQLYQFNSNVVQSDKAQLKPHVSPNRLILNQPIKPGDAEKAEGILRQMFENSRARHLQQNQRLGDFWLPGEFERLRQQKKLERN